MYLHILFNLPSNSERAHFPAALDISLLTLPNSPSESELSTNKINQLIEYAELL